MRREDGAAVVELALLLPLLALIAALTVPFLRIFLDINDVGGAVASGMRFATKVDRNASLSDDPVGCPDPTRRRSATQIREHVMTTGGRLLQDASQIAIVVDQPDPRPTIEDPCQAISGSLVSVTATYTIPVTGLGASANTLAGWFGADPIFVARVRSVTSVGVLE